MLIVKDFIVACLHLIWICLVIVSLESYHISIVSTEHTDILNERMKYGDLQIEWQFEPDVRYWNHLLLLRMNNSSCNPKVIWQNRQKWQTTVVCWNTWHNIPIKRVVFSSPYENSSIQLILLINTMRLLRCFWFFRI